MYKIAFDIGTTSCAGALLDTKKCRQIAVVADGNPQLAFGDDVISRIDFAKKDAKGLEKLNEKIIACINKITSQLVKQSGLALKDISGVAIAGNTAMIQFLLKIPTDRLAVAPYTSDLPRRCAFAKDAASLGIKIAKDAKVIFLPAIGGFVGSDLVAAILASELHKSKKPALLVDLGANGEIALKNKTNLLTASTAAGPAFEGGHIRFGMRAQKGAIELAGIKRGKVTFKVIGAREPKGVCGSGLISLAAEMLKNGIMDDKGRIEKPFKVYKSITLSQKDIREVQLAKAAIRSGIAVLMKRERITAKDLSAVYLTGAFGNFVDKKAAIEIGLIPKVALGKVISLNDGALEGAKKMLHDKAGIKEVEKIAKVAVHMRLFARMDFREEFITQMNFG